MIHSGVYFLHDLNHNYEKRQIIMKKTRLLAALMAAAMMLTVAA